MEKKTLYEGENKLFKKAVLTELMNIKLVSTIGKAIFIRFYLVLFFCFICSTAPAGKVML